MSITFSLKRETFINKWLPKHFRYVCSNNIEYELGDPIFLDTTINDVFKFQNCGRNNEKYRIKKIYICRNSK